MSDAFLSLLAQLATGRNSYELFEHIVGNLDSVPLCFEVMCSSDAPQNMTFISSIIAKRISGNLLMNPEQLVQVFSPFRAAMLSLLVNQPFEVSNVQACYLRLLRYAPSDDFLAIEERAMGLIGASDIESWVKGVQLMDILRDAYVLSDHSLASFYSKFVDVALRFLRFETMMNKEFCPLYRVIFDIYRKLLRTSVKNFPNNPFIAQLLQMIESVGKLSSAVQDETVTQMVSIVCDALGQCMCDLCESESIPDAVVAHIPVILRAAAVCRSVFPGDTRLSVLTPLLGVLVKCRRIFSEESLAELMQLALTAIPMAREEIVEDRVNPELLYEHLFECKSFSSGRALGLGLVRHCCSLNIVSVVEIIRSASPSLDIEAVFRVWSQVSEFIMNHMGSLPKEFIVSYGTVVATLLSGPISDEVMSLAQVALYANSSFLCNDDQRRELEGMALQLLKNKGQISYVYHMIGYMVLERLTRSNYHLCQESLAHAFLNQSTRIGFDQLSILNRVAVTAKEELKSLSRHLQSFLTDLLVTYVKNSLDYIDEIPNLFRCLLNLVASPYSEIDMESLGRFLIEYLNSDDLEEVDMCCQMLSHAVERGLPGCSEILCMVLDTAVFKDLQYFSETAAVELLFGTFMTHSASDFLVWPGRHKLLELLLTLYQMPQEEDTDIYFIAILLCRFLFMKAIDNEETVAAVFNYAMKSLLDGQADRAPIQDVAFFDIIASVVMTTSMELPQPLLERWRDIIQNGVVVDSHEHEFHAKVLAHYCETRKVPITQAAIVTNNYLKDAYPVLATRKPHTLQFWIGMAV